MKKRLIIFFEWMIDVAFIVCMELVQLCSVFICLQSYGSDRFNELELYVTIVINIGVIIFIRHTAIKGMPSKWINKLKLKG